MEKLNGLDLFSGIGGITIGLSDWVTPIAYCENDKFAISVLLSRMSEGKLPVAPIWDDVRTLVAGHLQGIPIDIIYAGFPCQDISTAGTGKGLEGERSSLFYEVMRLSKEIKPTFIFLENVPTIATRGLDQVAKEISENGYDCRWCTLSASEVGAPHNRERWWLLAHSKHNGSHGNPSVASIKEDVRDTEEGKEETVQFKGGNTQGVLSADTTVRPQETWLPEPDICRMDDGLPNRIHRIKSLGNSVVPFCVKTAFEHLLGLEKNVTNVTNIANVLFGK